MKQVYLALAVVGALVPFLFFFLFANAQGLAFGGFVKAVFANHAASMFASDLLISSAVFWLFMASRRGPRPWVFIGLNLFVGLSCALPAYLWAFERSPKRAGDGRDEPSS